MIIFVIKRHDLNSAYIGDILWNSLNIIVNIFRICPNVENPEGKNWPNRYIWLYNENADQMLFKHLDLNKIWNSKCTIAVKTENFSNSELWFGVENEINLNISVYILGIINNISKKLRKNI